MSSYDFLLAAEIASDFAVTAIKPYAVQAQWIMSEKYNTILTTFEVEYEGNPGYRLANSTPVYTPGVPERLGMLCVNVCLSTEPSHFFVYFKFYNLYLLSIK